MNTRGDVEDRDGPTRARRVLVVDDQSDIREAARLLLKSEGYGVVLAASPSEAVSLLDPSIDAALIDLNYARDTTSGDEGLALVPSLHATSPGLPVVVMTAWGSVSLAVEAMRRGACDFIEKPWDNTRLLTVLRTQIALAHEMRKGQRLEAENKSLRDSTGDTLLGESPAALRVRELIARVAPSVANVLITGENGTGKGVAARLIHAHSSRCQGAFITVNSGGLSEGVFESELFGHVRGAFTDAKTDRAGRFELADGGTLFLDEIGNLSMNMQARLLRVLETGELERVGSSQTKRVDVRVLCATNADLRAMVAAGSFRQDLLFRLNTVELAMPPLRERGDDILLLARHFLDVHQRRYRKRGLHFDSAASSALVAHGWPGNVRELDHAVERAVLLAATDTIMPQDLALQPQSSADGIRIEDLSLEEVEILLIRKALARHHGNVSHAANALGLSRSGLYRRIEKYGL